ncbi:SIMPL domain-containing protein [Limoniibacter endophyticus]|uniref:SIMPL domain-containing protein n=1 Tax=Limoniibacter endophyticus TaxID=1565040 RepID=A0A8J3DIG9_9HYPH|nr:SIMPL domain-containing protein [Limoniibacter endophyticus]GHC74910.1 SIMPL domain-containing protein [Limoniibacter endophyticus]
MKAYLLPLVLCSALVAVPSFAQPAAPKEPAKLIVSGEGEASIAPDMAIVNLAVMREAKTARDALSANNDAMAAVIASLKGLGIEERDLQTSGININPRYQNIEKDGNTNTELVAYQVTNTLAVRIRDIAKAGEVLDKSVTLGVNQGGNISFTNDNPDAIIEAARKDAVARARAKAETLAAAAGVKLGPVLEISENSYRPMPMERGMKVSMMAAADSVPVQAGENTYQVQVNITYGISQ